MASLYFKILLYENESVKAEHWELPYFYSSVHFHPEYQLTFIQESNGSLLVGDKMCDFSPGDTFIIGPNIPHIFRNEDSFYDRRIQNEIRARAIAIYFTKDSLGKGLLDIPEATRIKELLSNSVYGIKIPKGASKELTLLLSNILQKRDFEKVLDFLRMLDEISKVEEIEIISPLKAPDVKQKDEGSKINQVYEYVMKNYEHTILLHEIAELVNMSHYAFCRFFKQRTNKTFVQFLNEIRIGMACKHLVEGKLPINDIAYRTGFGNLSNFIRQFKKLNGETPSDYQKRIKKIKPDK